MSTAGYSLAEAHVLRELHKKKMKMEREERVESGTTKSGKTEMVQSKGCCSCCSWMLKKVRRSIVHGSSSAEAAENGT
ncbi:unnamed protein product [Malus baccata var. baccata]